MGDVENGYGCKRKKERKIRIRMEEGVRHITCSSARAASALEQRARIHEIHVSYSSSNYSTRVATYLAHPVQLDVWSSVEERGGGGGGSALKLSPTYAKDGWRSAPRLGTTPQCEE